ncbi:MAG: dephospho-CoA kinase [Clostridia bacterium]
MKPNRILGVTGRISSGKTSATRFIGGRGYEVVDADAVYHELLQTADGLRSELKEAFGTFDTRVLSRLLFGGAIQVGMLNEITHKYVIAEIKDRLAQHPEKHFVLDVPIPVREGFLDLCDRVLVMDCTYGKQLERLMKIKGIGEEEARKRIDIQMSREEYMACGDVIVHTSNMTLHDMEQALAHLFSFSFL